MTLVNAFEVADPDPKTIGILKMTKKLVPLLPANIDPSWQAGIPLISGILESGTSS
jgi:hypothetical protein